MKFLALDVGEKRIGLACGDSNTRIAVPAGFVETGGSEWQEIAQMANFYGITHLIIGLPRNNQGQETAQSAYVRKFARQLMQKMPKVKVHFQDETLTSVLAEERLKARGRPYQRGDIDAEAAAIILQDYLEGLRSATGAAAVNNSSGVAAAPTEVAPPEPQASQAPQVPPAKKSSKSRKKSQKEEKMSKKSAKKSKKSSKKLITGVISAILVVAVVAVLGVVGLFYLREQKRTERAEMYAQQEAEMQPEVFTFTVKPGETIYDVRDNLIAAGYSATEVEAALAANYDFPMLKNRPTGATLEGYLFGETQEFYNDTPATEVIEFFLEKMQDNVDASRLTQKFAAQGLTLHEGITLASVVQKEAKSPEMPTVAQVFLSRLAAGIPLGSDVTVSYALDTLDPDRESHSDNQAALSVDSCYNTRLYGGLPCGPISNPSLDALLAVANPSDTSYLYFLTGDDGLMYYSYTEEEHTQNAAEHCQDLCQVSL